MSFAQLAEELRRDGTNDEAVEVCRAGLAHHPDYLTARVTLGRALVELGRLDEAFTELTTVLDASPGNLPAIRALAEVYQRRGLMSEALVHYRRALQLAQHDADLEHTVGEIQRQVEPAGTGTTPPAPAQRQAIEDIFDFDSLVAQLGAPTPSPEPVVAPAPRVASPIEAVELSTDDQDFLALMERQLREREEQQLVEERQAKENAEERRRLLVMEELEHWLMAIAADRDPEQSQA
jgi:tetratricopeptide (TPR) repeat protein